MSDLRMPYTELPREARALTDFDARCLITSICDF
jgi:hypothetical protein